MLHARLHKPAVPAVIAVLTALTFVVTMMTTTARASAASPSDPRPHPNWTLRRSGGAETDLAVAPWACHGHANTPHHLSIPAGIGYDGYQDCTGAFDVQKICVKLQQKDYYGNFYDRTAFRCSRETVAGHAYVGGSVTCVAALEGTYRTYARGYAWPDGVQHTADGASTSIRLCVGF